MNVNEYTNASLQVRSALRHVKALLRFLITPSLMTNDRRGGSAECCAGADLRDQRIFPYGQYLNCPLDISAP
jgi:hypothetical protein